MAALVWSASEEQSAVARMHVLQNEETRSCHGTII